MEIPPDLPTELIPYAWLLGTWQGAGVGGYPTIDGFRFGQEIKFEFAGKPHLVYQSRTWLLDDDGNQVRPLARESGYLRPQPENQAEFLLAHPTGFVEIYLGALEGAKLEVQTDVVARTATAKEYTAGRRLYGLVEGDLLWAFDMAAMGQPLQAHISARLKRVG